MVLVDGEVWNGTRMKLAQAPLNIISSRNLTVFLGGGGVCAWQANDISKKPVEISPEKKKTHRGKD